MLALVFLTIFLGFATVLSLTMTSFEKQPKGVTAVRLRTLTRTQEVSRRSQSYRLRLREMVVVTAQRLQGQRGLLKRETTQKRLASAGFADVAAPDVYIVVRLAVLPLGIACGALVSHGQLLGMIVGVTLLSFAPPATLRQLTKRRREQIRRSMPDLVDLLVICVDAGLGLDQAVSRVAQELAVSHAALHEELMRVGGEQRAGKPRMQAWQDLASSLGILELDGFVSMLIQADRFGTPISRALSTFAARIRLQRTQVAEEQAAKTTVKILFPLVLFLFPTIFIVLLGPAVLTMIRAFSGGLGK